MKRLITAGLSTIFAVPLVSSAIVFAQAPSTTTPTNTEPNTKTNTGTTAPKPDAEKLKALQERLAKRKAELKIRLTNAEKLRLQSKCQASQGHVSSLKGRIQGIETSRAQVYSNMTDRLTKLSEKLKNKEADTAALDLAITELKTRIETFNTTLATYKLGVTDLAEMDCKTDPDGFKASLEASRTSQEQVSKDGKAIRAYVNDTIKPLLKTIRSELESKQTEGAQ